MRVLDIRPFPNEGASDILSRIQRHIQSFPSRSELPTHILMTSTMMGRVSYFIHQRQQIPQEIGAMGGLGLHVRGIPCVDVDPRPTEPTVVLTARSIMVPTKRMIDL